MFTGNKIFKFQKIVEISRRKNKIERENRTFYMTTKAAMNSKNKNKKKINTVFNFDLIRSANSRSVHISLSSTYRLSCFFFIFCVRLHFTLIFFLFVCRILMTFYKCCDASEEQNSKQTIFESALIFQIIRFLSSRFKTKTKQISFSHS